VSDGLVAMSVTALLTSTFDVSMYYGRHSGDTEYQEQKLNQKLKVCHVVMSPVRLSRWHLSPVLSSGPLTGLFTSCHLHTSLHSLLSCVLH